MGEVWKKPMVDAWDASSSHALDMMDHAQDREDPKVHRGEAAHIFFYALCLHQPHTSQSFAKE